MRTLPDDLSVLHNQDLIRVQDRPDPLGDDDLCLIRIFFIQPVTNRPVCLEVQGGEGVIKNQDLGRLGNGSCYGDTLSLAAGEIAASA